MSDTARKRTMQKSFRNKRAHFRVRNRVKGTQERPRLVVYKSIKYIYAQVINDDKRETLAQANSLEREIRDTLGGSAAGKEAARAVGEAVARRAKNQGVAAVVFDRGGYVYHGKVREVAEAARKEGLEF